MTSPYGVTDHGIARQLMDDGHTKEMGDEGAKAANYLKDCVLAALNDEMGSAKRIMDWLQAVAGALAEQDLPFRWQTPPRAQSSGCRRQKCVSIPAFGAPISMTARLLKRPTPIPGFPLASSRPELDIPEIRRRPVWSPTKAKAAPDHTRQPKRRKRPDYVAAALRKRRSAVN
jgi:DNA-dependent RNA polymerase